MRGNGEGTVYQLPNGKWRAEKTFGYTVGANGKQVRIYASKGTFKTKRDALEYLPQLKPKDTPAARKIGVASSGMDEKKNITLKQLLDLWIGQHEAAERTLSNYKSSFKVFAPLWDTKVCDLEIDDLQECLDSYTGKKGALNYARTQKSARSCLNLAFKYGIPRGYIRNNISGEANLASYLRIGKEESPGKVGISIKELEIIRQAIGKVSYADFVYCHCYLGFRPTALLALQVKDYNAYEHYFVGGIKTEAGKNRIVTISPKIQPIIDRLVSGKSQNDYVFSDSNGKQLTITQYRYGFYHLLDTLKIQPLQDEGRYRITPHSCRHTFSTLMKSVDAPTKDKLRLIGHTDEAMMMHYQDVNLEDLRRITDRI